MCFGGPTPKAPPAAPPPVTQGATQVQDAADQERKAAAVRNKNNQTVFGGLGNPQQTGQGQAGGQLKSLLG